MRGVTSVTFQPHQILHLPHKKTRMLDPRRTGATQNDHPKSDRNLVKTAEASFTVRGRSENDPSMIRP